MNVISVEKDAVEKTQVLEAENTADKDPKTFIDANRHILIKGILLHHYLFPKLIYHNLLFCRVCNHILLVSE